MAITNFISTVWSETLAGALDTRYVGVANCNRAYEGDIREQGAVVKICGIGEVTVGDYTKNTDMSTPQTLDDRARELRIDQAKYFNFQIDDIDRAQSSPALMNEAMRAAAAALANTADSYVFGLYKDAGSTYSRDITTPEQVIDMLISGRTALYSAGVTDASDIVLEVSPEVAALILKAKIALSTDNGEALEAGCLGSLGGCKIYVSSNIVKEVEGEKAYHMCLARSKRAIAFAEQLSEIDAYRPEKRFADAVKGLHLYGAKVVYPTELVVIKMGIPV
ncbi:MAG: P22 coat protein - protein 5 domain protein [Ruminococcaceae bacterium]|nr:P22 coat protein - protein 5 domain protein [Oscillospiraceae bacterium]